MDLIKVRPNSRNESSPIELKTNWWMVPSSIDTASNSKHVLDDTIFHLIITRFRRHQWTLLLAVSLSRSAKLINRFCIYIPCGYEWNWGFGVGRSGHEHSEPSVCDDTKYFPSWCHATERNGSADCHRISAHLPRRSHNTICPDSNAIKSCWKWQTRKWN